ncbi:MAG: ATP synthase F0 subunit B [Candidatus Harrisonbacteria bacterium CG10_big_fil_rev_8_21_14_0_10_49_15]|uniref:ATP synthase subunit b n=1 Tax=Candidatus Harrisonbacteria bacterium CG10_big_fil_rev_8_21_14_0_10_49_15 TaxID=1974587 RepID=A0A2H0UMS2_9BACT|nr:MAG: ATP synthase F0 subunit B [Candidatus Harrisonbacteria bacterium CG10_big_fil_rev_8_21_14_0_10_49_15]
MEEVLGKIGFDWKLAIVNFVNVFLIFLVLKKWAFGPIARIIEQRKDEVEASLAAAQNAEAQKLAAEAERQTVLGSARTDAQALIERAEGESKGIVDAGRAKALKEHEEILRRAEEQIRSSQKTSMDQVRAHAATLIASGVKKILAEEVDAKVDERIIKRAASAVKEL